MFELHDIERPYPGLRPFEAWEKEIFFGRLAHTERLLEILAGQHFLAVIGPSGSGKSSLVRAGLLPELPRGRLGTGTRWRIATCKPGNAPIQHLARALLQRSALGQALLPEARIPPTADAQTTEVALLEAELRLGPLSLVQVAQRAAQRLTQADQALAVKRSPLNLLVLVDQFEELFTYLDAGGSDAQAQKLLAEEADAFVNLLLKARAVPEARVCVVLTMRTDFLGACVRFLDLPDAINRAQYLTPRLQRSEIELAITGPAHHFGGRIDAGLVQALINTVGADADQLPILQHALGRAWSFAVQRAAQQAPGGPVEILAQDFEQAGGVQQALSQHADSVLASLSGALVVPQPLQPQQVLARELFCAITEQRSADSGGQTVRRPQSLARIAERGGRAPHDYQAVVLVFAEAEVNFLTFQGDLAPAAVIDISHEALIRQWDRLRGWVAAEAARAGQYRRLRRQAIGCFANDLGFSLLSGVALSRALGWLAGGAAGDDDGWRPSPHWAARYARQPTLDAAGSELALIQRYVQDSQQAQLDAEQRAAQAQARKLQDEKDTIERQAAQALLAEQTLRIQAESRRASDATQAASRQQQLNRLLVAALFVALALAGYSYHVSGQSDQRRQVIEGQALWLPLTIEVGRLGPKDLEALLAVARADPERLQAFATQLRDEETLAERFLREPAHVLGAWIGPSPAARRAALAVFSVATGRTVPGSPSPGGAARRLARAVLQLALNDDPAADTALAADLALAARSDRADDRDGWRILGNALLSLAPELPKTRRIAVYQALGAVAQDHNTAPARLLPLAVAMAALRDDQPDSEMPALFDLLLAAALDIADADMRRDAQRAGDAATSMSAAVRSLPLYLPPGIARAAVLRNQLAKVADRLPPAAAALRWRRVWDEIAQRQKAAAAANPSPDKSTRLDSARPAGAAELAEPAASASAGATTGGSTSTGTSTGINAARPAPASDAEPPARRGLDRPDLAGLLVALAARLPTEAVAPTLEQLLAVLARSATPLAAGNRKPSATADAELRQYSQALLALVPSLPPAQRLAVANRLLALYARRGLSTDQRDRLWPALRGTVMPLAGTEADDFARGLLRLAWRKDGSAVDELDQFYATDLWSSLQPRLSPALLALQPKWAHERGFDSGAGNKNLSVELPLPGPAAPLADVKLPLIRQLKRIADNNDPDLLRLSGLELETLAARTPASQLQEVSDTLLAAALATTDPDQAQALAGGLRGVLKLASPAQSRQVRQRLAQEIGSDPAGRPALAAIYAQLVVFAPPDEQLRSARDLLAQVDSGRASQSQRLTLDKLAKALAPSGAEAPALARDLVSAITNLPDNGAASADSASLQRPPSGLIRRPFGLPSQRVQALESVAAGLLQRLAPAQQATLGSTVLDGLLASQSAAGSAALGRLLKVVTGDTAHDRQQTIRLVFAALPRTSRAQDIDALLGTARELLAQQAADEQTARDLFDMMKYPGHLRKTVAVLRLLFKDAPAPDAGGWALVAWAQKKWPALPLDQRVPDRVANAEPVSARR